MFMLEQLLNSVLAEASLKNNVAVKRRLNKGLHVAVAVTSTGVHLSIALDKIYPSAGEWKTVLANFPYLVPFVEPTQFIDSDRRFALRAKLPRRDELPQQMALSVPESEKNNEL